MMMASSFGRQASLQAELHKRQLDGVNRKSSAKHKSSRRGAASDRHLGATSAMETKERPKTSYSRRSRTTVSSARSRTSNVQNDMQAPPSVSVGFNSRRTASGAATTSHQMSQISALTDNSGMTGSQAWYSCSQGVQSQRSTRTQSQGGGSMPPIPMGQPSQSSASRTRSTTGHSQLSQQSQGFIDFAASNLGMPLQRRSGGIKSSFSVASATTRSTNHQGRVDPPTSGNAQRLMKNLMAPVPMTTTFTASRQSLVAQTLARSSNTTQSSAGSKQHSRGGQIPTTSSLVGTTNLSRDIQQSQEAMEIKALVKKFEEIVADSTRKMDAKEAETLAKVEEKVSSGLDAMDSKLQAMDGKKKTFDKAADSAECRHQARVRYYSNKGQELDGKVAEVASVIATARDASITSIKETCGALVTKLHDVRTDIVNSLHNLPVPEMIKTLWKEFNKAKGGASASTSRIESTPKTPASGQRRRSLTPSSTMTTQSTNTKSSKTKKLPTKKTHHSKRDGRSILSPLQIVENPPRGSLKKKRRADVLDSPSSKVSVVTPTNLSRSFKRLKDSSVASTAVSGKRGRSKKPRTSAFSSNNVLRDDYGFLS